MFLFFIKKMGLFCPVASEAVFASRVDKWSRSCYVHGQRRNLRRISKTFLFVFILSKIRQTMMWESKLNSNFIGEDSTSWLPKQSVLLLVPQIRYLLIRPSRTKVRIAFCQRTLFLLRQEMKWENTSSIVQKKELQIWRNVVALCSYAVHMSFRSFCAVAKRVCCLKHSTELSTGTTL